MKDSVKNNIKVAHFVGTVHHTDTELYSFYDKVAGRYWHKEENLKFDTDWNWLMVAVEKMWSISRHRHLFYQEVRWNDGDDVMDQQKTTIFPTTSPDTNTAIEEVYSLVLNFIDIEASKLCV